jgi:hypothetical protein
VEQPQLVSRAQAVPRRVFFEGKISKVVDYFGGAAPFGGAQAYLVEQKNYVLRAHLHPVDQFQILYGAPGSLFARRPIADLVVHYADAYTVYGPLVGADPPLRYFTLRAQHTDATEFMPQARALVPKRPGRSLHRDLDPSTVDGPAPARSVSSTVLDDQRDGLRVTCVSGGAGAPITVPEAGPAGQFSFVVGGSVESGGASYGPETVGWHPAGSAEWVGTAGSDGAALLVLRFPQRSGARTGEA